MDKKYDIRKTYLRLCGVILLGFLIFLLAAGYFRRAGQEETENLYRVEISRIERLLPADPDQIDLSGFETIRGVSVYEGESEELARFFDPDFSYVIREAGGKLYRIDYEVDQKKARYDRDRNMFLVLACAFLLILFLLVWIYVRLIREFHKLSEYPFELAKGNLTMPLKEEKNHYFGRFLWGLDMLREKLEEEKKKNLDYQKERNTFLLSLSHDTKTPLSAIKLYAAAMKKHLYKEPEKQAEIAERIDGHVGEIEGYISKIISASGEEFMNFDVKNEEFYLSEVISRIETYYSDKLREVGCTFSIGEYRDSLLVGDADRMVEVLQNLMENAIKYGDGGEIRLFFAEEEDVRLITVENTGCELPEQELGSVFDSFYRGSNVGSKNGSGLGLYICKKLMNRMKGEIFAEIDHGVMKVTLVCHKHS